jgi:hypothetical protein
MDLGDGRILYGRQLSSDLGYLAVGRTHVIYQPLRTILNLIIGVKEVNMLLDDLLRIFSPTHQLHQAVTKLTYPN